ncbi:MAG: hypothetical protein ABSF91_12360 [Bacteroidota bacterium]|jgi:hypothetical protein
MSYSNQKVYLIHGYGSSTLLLKSIENYLKKNGFETVNYSYHSIRDDIRKTGHNLYNQIKQDRIDTVSFVTHSMGALVMRALLTYSIKDSSFPTIYRIVMITPPNHGTEIADFFSSSSIFKFFLGPNVENMKTDSNSLANRLPLPLKSQVGIIVGEKSDSTGYNPFIKGSNDGYVTPDEAKLGMEKDFRIIYKSHTLITQSKKTRRLVLSFLRNGTFGKK